MPFDAAVLGLVEESLSGVFSYHDALDEFLLRSGISPPMLEHARQQAEEIFLSSGREYSRAPKRYVVKQVLKKVNALGSDGDVILANIITGLTKGRFPDANDPAVAAISDLISRQKDDVEQKRRAQEEEKARRADIAEAEERRKTEAHLLSQQKRDQLRDEFVNLMMETNAQQRGYLLETFLSDLFDSEGLESRRSFRLTGEQIDGSFSLGSRTYLVEAKWVKSAIAGAEFSQFIYKIDGKTADTRGVYISVNGYSPEALQGLNGKGALKFICLDGAHLMRVLTGGEKLPELLRKLWRHADETGEAYLPANQLH